MWRWKSNDNHCFQWWEGVCDPAGHTPVCGNRIHGMLVKKLKKLGVTEQVFFFFLGFCRYEKRLCL